jgi:hypothetical protein
MTLKPNKVEANFQIALSENTSMYGLLRKVLLLYSRYLLQNYMN